MTTPIYRYGLDPTGTNPDNFVQGEVITLADKPLRAAVPKYGPIFSENLVVYDDATNAILTRNVDYKHVELVQSATSKFGKEIIAAILITNINVSSDIRLNYQVLGGLYQFDDAAIIDLYNTYLNDTRSVEWDNVINKPLVYPPSLHNHLIDDVYGFEPVIVALERIRNAIAVTDLPAYQAMVEWVRDRVEHSTFEDIRDGVSNNRVITNERLIQALSEFNFNSLTINPLTTTAVEGDVLNFNIRSTNLLNNTVLYWTLENISTSNSDFGATSGIINMVNNEGNFSLPINVTQHGENAEEFTIFIRKNGVNGFVLAKTPNITLAGHGSIPFIDLKVACCLFNPNVPINPCSYYMTREY